MWLFKKALVIVVLSFFFQETWSQCGSGALPAIPTNSWVGYVYDGINNFSNYQGSTTESQNFDRNDWPDNGTFNTTNGCAVNTETFTVRYEMSQTFTCGYYTFTVGADDGVRLSLDNGATYIIDQFQDESFTTYTTTVFVTAGTKTLVLDYYENGGQNRISYAYTTGASVTTSSGGTVAADQSSCATGFDPAVFTSSTPAGYCSGATITGYQWEKSTTSNSTGFADIVGATGLTYDDPGPVNATTWYRRRASDGSTLVYSNVLTVTIDTPGTDQTTPGSNSWIGYVYDGRDDYTNFVGSYTESDIFDESFCGDNCTFVIDGCDFNTETFTIRYRMSFTVAQARDYTFVAGGDDGYRFSIAGVNGGAYIIDNYGDHGYVTTTSAVVTLNPGTYSFVLDYFENSGGNRVSFSYSSVLPVTWSYFDGYFQNRENVIEWKTATELNNHGFVVERSTNGKTFDSLGFVDGVGTSNMISEYEFHDSNPYHGWNYYRLKQIDHDRKFEYSRLIPVYSEITGSTAIYPNPASGDLYISHVRPEQSMSVAIRGVMNGKFYPLINDPKQPSKFSLKNVAPGMYLVTVTIDHEIHSEKLIVY
ncbi:MAG: T9SS type A sorting domain-containing protein [Chryseolinea sp.]